MRLRPDRLRRGEAAAGLLGVALIVVLVVVGWYHHPAQFLPRCTGGSPCGQARGTLTGWQSFTTVRWAILLCVGLALALALTQMACRGPALPLSLAMLLCVTGGVVTLWLLVRLLLGAPGRSAGATGGGWVELGLLVAVVSAAVGSMRQEGIREADGPGEVPCLDPLGGTAGGAGQGAAT
jgi:hypothetical protein